MAQTAEGQTAEVQAKLDTLTVQRDAYRKEAYRAVNDLQHFLGAHASEYASRRLKELSDTLSQIDAQR